MRQTTKRFLSMILALVLVVGAFVILIDFTIPAYEESGKVRSGQLSRQSFVERQSQTIKQVQNLINAYEGQGQVQEIVSLALPTTQDVAGALAQLNGLAQADRLAPQAFSASAAEVQSSGGARTEKTESDAPIKPLATLSLQVKFVGAYDDLQGFLKRLESNIRVFDVRSLTVQPVGRSTQDLYSYDMTVIAYYQNP
ncbi:hypothetical protein C4571_02535 [Candidatus Parcubacteria bacterium]|nr:MAG: hypothetical protein C4571_02535 [Candidatus Parcubacteria bacterium]